MEHIPAAVGHFDVAHVALADTSAGIVFKVLDAVVSAPVSILKTPLELTACGNIDHGEELTGESIDWCQWLPTVPGLLNRRANDKDLCRQCGRWRDVGCQHAGQGDDV